MMQQMLRVMLAPLLRRNRRFAGVHRGESCYLLGNGVSLKQMDLPALNDHLAIGLNLICLHKEFGRLTVPYYVVPEAFFFYPWFWSTYLNRYEPNMLGRLLKSGLRRHTTPTLFTSASNVLGARAGTHFLHHFGHRQADKRYVDAAGVFSFMTGSLYCAVGLAIFLGFRRVMLVGCDYMFSPGRLGHFYSYGPGIPADSNTTVYDPLLAEVRDLIDVVVVTPDGTSHCAPSVTYTELTGRPTRYRENHEIVEPDDLQAFHRAHVRGQYQMPILADQA